MSGQQGVQVGPVMKWLSLVELHAREAREMLAQSVVAAEQSRQPQLQIARPGDLSIAGNVPSAAAQALNAAQHLGAGASQHCDLLLQAAGQLQALLAAAAGTKSAEGAKPV